MKVLTLFFLTACAACAEPGIPDSYKLVYSQDFSDADAAWKDFQFTDRSVWKIGKEEDGKAYLEHFKKSNYKYKVRSPYNIALVSKLKLKNFVYEIEMKQTGKEYAHRDMCLFYNFVDRSHFYYTHISTKSDPHAHQCFIVNDKPRTAITKEGTDGFKWGGTWHTMRVVRDADAGTTKIFADDMTKPIMVVEGEKTFGWGHVGFGSFDDTGRVAAIKIYAAETQPGEAGRELFKD